ncbi:MAG: rhodanese-like domain-containing protein [Candidatus Binataceae bacterium]
MEAVPAPTTMNSRSRFGAFALDCAGVAVLAVASLIVALAANKMRAAPMPPHYRTPEQRLAKELTSLVHAPPFQLSNFTTVDVGELRTIVAGKKALILDARDASFFAQGHVPGALNLARDNFAHDYLKLRPILNAAKDKPIVVYCSGGECQDSRLVGSALESLGFSGVRIFPGGWPAWSEAGAPVAH